MKARLQNESRLPERGGGAGSGVPAGACGGLAALAIEAAAFYLLLAALAGSFSMQSGSPGGDVSPLWTIIGAIAVACTLCSAAPLARYCLPPAAHPGWMWSTLSSVGAHAGAQAMLGVVAAAGALDGRDLEIALCFYLAATAILSLLLARLPYARIEPAVSRQTLAADIPANVSTSMGMRWAVFSAAILLALSALLSLSLSLPWFIPVATASISWPVVGALSRLRISHGLDSSRDEISP